ncbi:phytanoyl-CoA dioxygenase family protein [Paenibacillus filicis]|uniref:Phytanoyl-CoA dioxygenase family protein n=1 Tax=Paenibacillus gyeongsangnamensis TaxID=3388067 RepID=A0ABT4QG72_9BACL|nr:phytanoyl-CoA dioxygenase family protein [Paenibacillus filicis]MCZ8515797.1 phytanoyl-CoA dioxygenase family protein [Paenibacillus filicis]
MANADVKRQEVSEEQMAFFQEYGFVQVDNVLTAEEIKELTMFIEESMSEEEGLSVRTSNPEARLNYYRVLNQKVNVWRDHAGMARYTTHPKLASIALKLSGASGIRLFHDHALWKMPQDSKATPWHQDFPYWPMKDQFAHQTLSAWIPLDDVDEQNGCMMFIPGSHKIGKLRGINLSDPQDIFQYVQGTGLDNTQPVNVPLRKGSCTFHTGLTFHYSHPNKTDKPRRVLAIIFMPDGVVYDGKDHVVTKPLKLAPGTRLQGGVFPLLAGK